MRNRFRLVLLGTLLFVGTAACGDKTVTSQPAESNQPTPTTTVSSSGGAAVEPASDAAADDADLKEIETLLRDIDSDVSATDADVRTPEGDPTL